MNIKAIYLALEQKEINVFKFLDEEELKKEVSLKLGESEAILDIDIYWDALHFTLVGTSFLEPDYLNSLSEMILGTYPFFEESEDYISFIDYENLNKIIEELNKVNIYEKTLNLTLENLAKNDIYPNNFNEYKEEHDRMIREEIRDYFNKLKIFFNNTYKNKKGIIISIL